MNYRFSAALTAATSALLMPSVAFAGCALTDPGCYIDDFAHKQLYQLDLSVWQINRAGLVMARWLEDLRVWLTDAVLADAFTSLLQPVRYFFLLALIVAWMVFVISFLVQSLIELNWVDIRRAMRPMLLAFVIFSLGGTLLKGTEQARLIGGTLLQQAAAEAMVTVDAPPIPTENTGDMADATSSIYSSRSSCGTPARDQAAMFLNDYSARYLWANSEDIHCADVRELAQEFRETYFPYGDDISSDAANDRQKAVGLAAQGGTRQITGAFMVAGAVIEQAVQLLFALALALVWFSILISLVFALFLPTESLFSSQIRALLGVMRSSWLASFLIGLGLALLQIVAKSGNGLLMFICGLILIAVVIWQGRQALSSTMMAVGALGTVSGNAPQAIGGMLKGWAVTGAVVAGVAATGGLGATMTSVGSTMLRRAGRSLGDNPLSEAAGRVLTNRVASKLDAYTQDSRLADEVKLSNAEAAWYERGAYEGAGTPEADADAETQTDAAQERAITQQARLLERRAERARQARNFALAARLRREAASLRQEDGSSPDATRDTMPIDTDAPDPIAMDAALEQLHEAQDDPEAQQRVLTEYAGSSLRQAQLKAMRNQALREKRFDDAKAAIRELRTIESEPQSEQTTDITNEVSGSEQPRTTRKLRPRVLSGGTGLGPIDEERAPTLAEEATIAVPTFEAGQPLAVARTRHGLIANGHSILSSTEVDGDLVQLATPIGDVTVAKADYAQMEQLVLGEALRVPTVAKQEESMATAPIETPVIPAEGERPTAVEHPTARNSQEDEPPTPVQQPGETQKQVANVVEVMPAPEAPAPVPQVVNMPIPGANDVSPDAPGAAPAPSSPAERIARLRAARAAAQASESNPQAAPVSSVPAAAPAVSYEAVAAAPVPTVIPAATGATQPLSPTPETSAAPVVAVPPAPAAQEANPAPVTPASALPETSIPSTSVTAPATVSTAPQREVLPTAPSPRTQSKPATLPASGKPEQVIRRTVEPTLPVVAEVREPNKNSVPPVVEVPQPTPSAIKPWKRRKQGDE